MRRTTITRGEPRISLTSNDVTTLKLNQQPPWYSPVKSRNAPTCRPRKPPTVNPQCGISPSPPPPLHSSPEKMSNLDHKLTTNIINTSETVDCSPSYGCVRDALGTPTGASNILLFCDSQLQVSASADEASYVRRLRRILRGWGQGGNVSENYPSSNMTSSSHEKSKKNNVHICIS